MKTIFNLALTVLLPLAVFSQWTNNPMANTLIADIGHNCIQSKTATDGHNQCYISYWVNIQDSTDRFELRLQRIDTNGYRMWGDSGILVSRHPTRTWLSDYSLLVDTSGNAVIFLEDKRDTTFSQVFGYSVTPSGQMRWGADGIRLAYNTNCSSYSPNAILTSAGNIIVGWNILFSGTSSANMAMQVMKLSDNGTKLWSQPRTFTGPDTTYMFPQFTVTDNDNFIMVWTRYVEHHSAVGEVAYKYIYSQRYDDNGIAVWPANAAICDLDTLALTLPDSPDWSVVRDGSGGTFIAWYDDRTQSDYNNVYVQHVDKDGNLAWQKNGIGVSTINYGTDRRYPVACYLPGTDELSVWWSEVKQEPLTYLYQLTAQKFNMSGGMQWSDTGKTYCSSGPDSSFMINNVLNATNRDVVVFFNKTFLNIIGPDTTLSVSLSALRVDNDGTTEWNPASELLSGTTPLKFSSMASRFNNQYFVAWSENRNGDPTNPYGEIYAQNISIDGKLGPLGISEPAAALNESRIIPNPSTGRSELSFTTTMRGEVEISVYSSTGTCLQTIKSAIAQDGTGVLLHGESLPAGLYLVKITGTLQTGVLRWMIMR